MRVNVDSRMLNDPRFKKLGQRLGISHYEAMGRVLPVWTCALEQRSAYMAPDDVDALAELVGFASALVTSQLADMGENGRLRLRGVEDRVEYLLDQDAKRALALAAKKAKREQHLARARAMGLPPGTPSGDVPREAPQDVPSSLDHDHVPDRDHDQDPREQIPPKLSGTRSRITEPRVVEQVWAEMAATRTAIAAELGVTVRDLPEFDPGKRDLAARMNAGFDPERAAADARHVIAVGAAEARAERSLQWFGGALFSEKNWRRALNLEPSQARARAGPGRGRPDDEIRPFKPL